jgi:outer membrane protein TolC
LLFIGFSSQPLPAEDPGGGTPGGYVSLLEKYLANDAGARMLELELEQAALELERYAADQGLSLTLSSGETALVFSGGGTSVSSEPGLAVSSPKWRDTSLSFAAPVRGNSGEGINGYGFSVEARTGIISGKGTAYRASLLEKERQFLQAGRNARARRLEAEGEFCEAIKGLLAARNTVLEAQGEVLTARYDLESKRAGGYGSGSVILRSAELKLRSRERELAEAERSLEGDLKQFAESCGLRDAEIPADIPEGALLRVSSFDPARYTELEAAVSAYSINSLARKSRNYPFTLDGRAGYSWQNDSSAGTVPDAVSGSRVNAGADLSAGGVSLGVGVSLPLQKPEPAVTLSLEWKLNGFKLFKIDRRLGEIQAAQEQENIIAAEKKFRDISTEYERKFGDLEWRLETYTEEAELFRLNAVEQEIWLGRGIIREIDYIDARTEYLSAVNRLLQAKIDRRLYNIEVEKLFVNDGTE